MENSPFSGLSWLILGRRKQEFFPAICHRSVIQKIINAMFRDLQSNLFFRPTDLGGLESSAKRRTVGSAPPATPVNPNSVKVAVASHICRLIH
ncbi:hypothetical protein J6590_016647 [Homalodisca vitripennis]|nr:hypothetical protein J6590_016647 [Homalodisca vitripennis]